MRFLTVLFLALFLPASALADTFEDALDARVRGDYQTTLKLIQPLADQGNADAQRLIGDMYFAGEGVKQDNAEGLKWYEKAAAHSGDYQGRLASLYFEGRVVEQNNAEGLKWLLMSGNSGIDKSQRELGKIYEEGKITKQDYQEALFWYALPKSNSGGYMVADENNTLEMMKHCTAEQIAAVQQRVSGWKPAETRETGASHPPVRLYSWMNDKGRWNFRLISGGYLGHPSLTDIFDGKQVITDLEKLRAELAKLPGVTDIQWADHLPSDRSAPAIAGSEKLGYPPMEMKHRIISIITDLNLEPDLPVN